MSNINVKQLSGYAFTPSQNYLAMSQMALNQFWVKANDTNIIDALTKGFTQPLDYVNFIRVYPFDVMGTTYDETNVPVPIANKFVNVPNNRTDALLKTSHVGNAKSIIHKQVSFNFGVKSNFSESEPYTTCECFLPYVGFITLASSELYGDIVVDLIIDVISGNGTYTISRNDYVIYTTQATFCVDIALGGTNNINQFRSQFNNGLNALTGIGLMALGVYTSNPYVAMGGVESTSKAISNIPETQTTYAIKRGTLGAYPTAFNNPHSIYFIFKKKIINDYDGFKATYGKPLNKNYTLSYLKGMTYIPNPKIEIPNITSDEYDTLVGLLQNGVILGLTKDKPIVYNVSLSGVYTTYHEHKLEVSNVSLSGEYSYKHKIEVSNVSLTGTYMFKPKLEVSNVTLSGEYTNLKLNVINVSLSGNYSLYVEKKVNVSNVKLIGEYTIFYEHKLEVSNVKLSGEYTIKPKVAVSNVKLTGTYNNLKVKVSNVKLSGTYTIKVPTSYTLTFYRYTNGELLDKRTYDITSGEYVFPDIYARQWTPEGYELSSYEPTEWFIMSSDATIKAYYVRSKVNVTNVKLSGEYTIYYAHKLSISNVKLSGEYTIKPKVAVSNVKLTGTYNNLKVKVSNVKLTGTYDLAKIKVTNVKLSGTYSEEKSLYPVKGNLITMTLGNATPETGTQDLYRVLSIEGTVAKVVAMYNQVKSYQFRSTSTNQKYIGSLLDTYLNSTWYNTLSTEAKTAIVEQIIFQYKYSNEKSTSEHASDAKYSSKTSVEGTTRKVYALDVEDIEMYFGGTGGSASANTPGTYTNADLWTLFYNTTSQPSDYSSSWLRSASAHFSWYIYYINGYSGKINDASCTSQLGVRPAFVIDLSKIDYKIIAQSTT